MIYSRFISVFDDASSLAPSVTWNIPARVLLIAIAGQESDWDGRLQVDGPARGYWQFESEAVASIVANAKAGPKIAQVCGALDIPVTNIYEAIAWNDTLAAMMARLLLWLDPTPLPAVGDVNGAYAYYLRNWRPGAQRPNNWPIVYQDAETALGVT